MDRRCQVLGEVGEGESWGSQNLHSLLPLESVFSWHYFRLLHVEKHVHDAIISDTAKFLSGRENESEDSDLIQNNSLQHMTVQTSLFDFSQCCSTL